jgi:hypothetical protein
MNSKCFMNRRAVMLLDWRPFFLKSCNLVCTFAQKCMLPFLVHFYYIWIFRGKFSFACLCSAAF